MPFSYFDFFSLRENGTFFGFLVVIFVIMTCCNDILSPMLMDFIAANQDSSNGSQVSTLDSTISFLILLARTVAFRT